jgi:hypothetical protein
VKYQLPNGIRIVPGKGGDGWAWVYKNEYPQHNPVTGKYFVLPEDAAKHCIETLSGKQEKQKDESVRRTAPVIGDGDEGYDANGSPVPAVQRGPQPGKDSKPNQKE